MLGGGQNIVLGTAGEGGEQHRPVPLIEAGGDTVKRAEGAGQRAAGWYRLCCIGWRRR